LRTPSEAKFALIFQNDDRLSWTHSYSIEALVFINQPYHKQDMTDLIYRLMEGTKSVRKKQFEVQQETPAPSNECSHVQRFFCTREEKEKAFQQRREKAKEEKRHQYDEKPPSSKFNLGVAPVYHDKDVDAIEGHSH
jgi:hypothetical protein